MQVFFNSIKNCVYDLEKCQDSSEGVERPWRGANCAVATPLAGDSFTKVLTRREMEGESRPWWGSTTPRHAAGVLSYITAAPTQAQRQHRYFSRKLLGIFFSRSGRWLLSLIDRSDFSMHISSSSRGERPFLSRLNYLARGSVGRGSVLFRNRDYLLYARDGLPKFLSWALPFFQFLLYYLLDHYGW